MYNLDSLPNSQWGGGHLSNQMMLSFQAALHVGLQFGRDL